MALDHPTELAVTARALVDSLQAVASTPAVAIGGCIEAAIQLQELYSPEPMNRAQALEHLQKMLAEQWRAELRGAFS